MLLGYDLARFAAATSALDYGHADLLRLPWALFEGAPDLVFVGTWRAKRSCATTVGPVGSWTRCLGLDRLRPGRHARLRWSRLASYPLVFLQAADFMGVDDQQRLLGVRAQRAGGGWPRRARTWTSTCGRSALSSERATDVRSVWRGTWRGRTDHESSSVRRLARPQSSQVDDTRLEWCPIGYGRSTLLFVANPTPESAGNDASLRGRAGVSSSDGSSRAASDATASRSSFAPYTVEIFEVQPRDRSALGTARTSTHARGWPSAGSSCPGSTSPPRSRRARPVRAPRRRAAAARVRHRARHAKRPGDRPLDDPRRPRAELFARGEWDRVHVIDQPPPGARWRARRRRRRGAS